jgi:hypothetical protein
MRALNRIIFLNGRAEDLASVVWIKITALK